MPNNNKKEYPINGLEQDVVYARDIYRYLQNNNKTVKWAKRQLNKRFRKNNKKEINNEID